MNAEVLAGKPAATSSPIRSSKGTARAIFGSVAIALGFAGCFAWKIRSDSSVAWLSSSPPQQWIVHPAPADTSPRRLVQLDTTFRREFQLETVPSSARLRFRAFRDARVH